MAHPCRVQCIARQVRLFGVAYCFSRLTRFAYELEYRPFSRRCMRAYSLQNLRNATLRNVAWIIMRTYPLELHQRVFLLDCVDILPISNGRLSSICRVFRVSATRSYSTHIPCILSYDGTAKIAYVLSLVVQGTLFRVLNGLWFEFVLYCNHDV